MAGLGKLSYRGFAKPGLCRWLGWGNRAGKAGFGEAGLVRLGRPDWGIWRVAGGVGRGMG